jgi:hypothetical protein
VGKHIKESCCAKINSFLLFFRKVVKGLER